MPPPYRYIGGILASANSIQLVESAEDLTGTLSSTICYFIDGIIDMGSTSISVPNGGLTIQGCGFGVSKLITSAANATLFNGSNAGNLFITNMEVEVTGTGSKVFDLQMVVQTQ